MTNTHASIKTLTLFSSSTQIFISSALVLMMPPSLSIPGLGYISTTMPSVKSIKYQTRIYSKQRV